MRKVLGYLSFRGRANRARFWLTGIAIYAIMFVSSVVAVGLSNVSPFFSLLFLPLFAAALIASLANAARRLHDRAKSAWWLLVFIVLPMLLLMPAEIARDSGLAAATAAFPALLGLLSLPFSIWAFVEMGCLKGTTGPNRYGADPLQPIQEVFA